MPAQVIRQLHGHDKTYLVSSLETKSLTSMLFDFLAAHESCALATICSINRSDVQHSTSDWSEFIE